MASERNSDYNYNPDLNSIESKFCYDLMQYVLDKYQLPAIFFELLRYYNANNKSEDESKLSKKAFCSHIGDAVFAISHHYRPLYKQRFDSMYPDMVRDFDSLKCCILVLVEEIFDGKNNKIAMLNAFLMTCSLFMEVVVYMAFRGQFVAFFVWCFFEELFKAAFKQDFDQCGGWMFLKQVARPWWKMFQPLEVFIQSHRPEYIYYLRSKFNIKKFGLSDIYLDEDSSDSEVEPPNVGSEELNSIAMSSEGCFRFCFHKIRFGVQIVSADEKAAKNLSTALTNMRSSYPAVADIKKCGAKSDSTQSRHTAEVVESPVPPLIRYREENEVPSGFLPRILIVSEYRNKIEKSQDKELLSIFDALFDMFL